MKHKPFKNNLCKNKLTLYNLLIMTDCDVNCHKKCEKLTANLCGVNQKLIVEALSSVEKKKSGTCYPHFIQWVRYMIISKYVYFINGTQLVI